MLQTVSKRMCSEGLPGVGMAINVWAVNEQKTQHILLEYRIIHSGLSYCVRSAAQSTELFQVCVFG